MTSDKPPLLRRHKGFWASILVLVIVYFLQMIASRALMSANGFLIQYGLLRL